MRFACLLGVVLVASAFAQEQGEFKKSVSKTIKSTSAPVTRAEARKVLDRAWTVMVKGLKLKGAAPFKLVSDSTPISKNEMLAEMDLLLKATTPFFKRSPRPATFDAARLRTDGDLAKMKFMVSKGLVMPLGPLVTGKNGPLTTEEFGDAVGVLMVRIADLCHLPSTTYSPNLMPG